MVFINSAPKPPQTTLKIVKNFLLLSIIIILPKHSLIQSLNVIVGRRAPPFLPSCSISDPSLLILPTFKASSTLSTPSSSLHSYK